MTTPRNPSLGSLGSLRSGFRRDPDPVRDPDRDGVVPCAA
jgi:hypothetical protein